MDKQEGQKTKKYRYLIGILGVLLIIIIVSATAIILHLSNRQVQNPSETETKPKKDLIVNEENASSIREELMNPETDVAPPTYDVMMNADWYFQDGKSPSKNASVSNYKTNSNVVYFDVILQDSNEVVYSSPYISVGAEINHFQLDKPLEEGTYDAVCKYYILGNGELVHSICKCKVVY